MGQEQNSSRIDRSGRAGRTATVLAPDGFGALRGTSPAIEKVRDALQRIALSSRSSSRLPAVLIEGETGTGKGLVAALLHRLGPRADGPFVDVNCAAIPETLLESELFGFEQGAFTDARRSKIGLFQSAHRGTVFLDEIGLLSQGLQAKLLKVLEDRVVRRLGGTRSEPIDAWVISATNADLREAMAERRFREDLYHRLALVRLVMPPLRERGDDVEALANHFLERACADYGLQPRVLEPAARARLRAHHWPGNVRELANVMERAALLSDSPRVTAAMLQFGAAAESGRRPGTARESAPRAGRLDSAAGEHIQRVLAQTGNNISRAAATLGITRNTLRARLRKLRAPGAREEARPPTSSPGPPVQTQGTLPAAVLPISPPSLPGGGLRWYRQRVTVVFAAFAEGDHESESPGASRMLEATIDKILGLGGRLEGVGQTTLTASFGLAPLEDAPHRAAHAAMVIRNAALSAVDYGARTPVATVALHTSPVLVGRFGRHAWMDRDSGRRALQVLEALTAEAEPGSIVVSADSAPFLDRRFELRPVRALAARPTAYGLEGPRRLGLGLWGRIGPFVGRRQESDLLASRWLAARRGEGHVVGVVGGAGLGKSRLVWEFARNVSPRDGRVLQTGALPEDQSPYAPIADLLRSFFDIRPGDDAVAAAGKVTAALGSRDPAAAETGSALLALLGVPDAGTEWRTMEPAERRRRTIEGVHRFLFLESRAQPLALVVEDAQWLDGETQALLNSVVDGLATEPLLIVLTYRPEYRHPWSHLVRFTQLDVDPLSAQETMEVLDNLLGTSASLNPVKTQLAEWTEGNPLFAEESVRALVETEALAGERGDYRLTTEVPTFRIAPTVEEVILARLSRLPLASQHVVAAAAALGRSVPAETLASIVDLPESALAAALRELQDAEVLYQRAEAGEVGFIFRHPLTHQVAYQMIEPGRRRALHARILEALDGPRATRPTPVERLAHHAVEGLAWARAVDYLHRAGRQAFDRSANEEAVAFLRQALEVMDRLPVTRERQIAAIDIRFELRHALWALGNLAEGLAAVRVAREVAERLGDGRRLARALSHTAGNALVLGRNEEARRAGEDALALARQLEDVALQIDLNQLFGVLYTSIGEYRRAVEFLQRNIALLGASAGAGRFQDFYGTHARTWLAWALADTGDFAGARREASDALRLAEEGRRPQNVVAACWGLGYVDLAQERVPSAVALLERAVSLARTAGITVWLRPASAVLGHAYAVSGRLGEALGLLEEAVAESENTVALAAWQTFLAEAYMGTDRTADAVALVAHAMARAEDRGEMGFLARALVVQAAIARGQSQTALATAALERALGLAEPRGMRPLALRCHRELALVYRAAGAEELAEDHERRASALAQALSIVSIGAGP